MGNLSDKVAIVPGAARGQGRAHALALARAGASVVCSDLCANVGSIPYSLGTDEDLAETLRLIESENGTAISVVADCRQRSETSEVAAQALDRLGNIDILVANAGVCSWHPFVELTEDAWSDVIDTNLTGVANTLHAVLPHMMGQGAGRIVVTGSTLGRQGMANCSHYSAAKWGLHGLVKSIAMEVAPMGITINLVNPTIVNTPMMDNEAAYKLFCPDIEHPTREDALPRYATLNHIPMSWMEPEEIANAMLFLVSDESRYITGTAMDVAAGANTTYTA